MERSYYYFLEVFFLRLVFFSSFREPLFSVYKFSKTQIIAMFKRSHKKNGKRKYACTTMKMNVKETQQSLQ